MKTSLRTSPLLSGVTRREGRGRMKTGRWSVVARPPSNKDPTGGVRIVSPEFQTRRFLKTLIVFFTVRTSYVKIFSIFIGQVKDLTRQSFSWESSIPLQRVIYHVTFRSRSYLNPEKFGKSLETTHTHENSRRKTSSTSSTLQKVCDRKRSSSSGKSPFVFIFNS